MKKPRRTRRTAEEAARAILDAAEKRLESVGPAGLRLQDVADDVGISHPAVLHHFGSREALVQAVVSRAIEKLHADLFRGIAEAPHDGVGLFDRVFHTLATGGQARLIGWLLLSGYDPLDSEMMRQGWVLIAEAMHGVRVKAFKDMKKKPPPYEDTLFAVIASSLTLFGLAIGGKSVFRVTGLRADAAVDKRFREWLAALFAEHLQPA